MRGRVVGVFLSIAGTFASLSPWLMGWWTDRLGARALEDTNTELEQRRRHIETILENVPTGVLSLDPEKRVSHSNVAFGRMFWPNGGLPIIGSSLRGESTGRIALKPGG